MHPAMLPIEKEEAARRLRALIKSREAIAEAYKRKRSMRPSEKAMATSDIGNDIRALRLALELIEDSAKPAEPPALVSLDADAVAGEIADRIKSGEWDGVPPTREKIAEAMRAVQIPDSFWAEFDGLRSQIISALKG